MKSIPKRASPINTEGYGRIYLASPLPTFGTPYYARMVGLARACFPHAELVCAADCFRSTVDWLARWPEVLAAVTGLVFFPEPDGIVGMGVFKEVEDAAERLPVWCLTPQGQLFTLAEIDLEPCQPRTPRTFARVARRTTQVAKVAS